MNEQKQCIIFQIGAREHYALAEGFSNAGKDVILVSDYWHKDNSLKNWLYGRVGLKSLCLRKNDRLQVPVVSFNAPLLWFELRAKLKSIKGWQLVIHRNKWFQKKAARWLDRYLKNTTARPVIFSYSYAAKEVFEVAKKYGCKTVLGQIDGGKAEEAVVKEEVLNYPEFNERFTGIPSTYWKDWEIEVRLADTVVVNSHWSCRLAKKNNVPEEKIRVIPLAYAPPSGLLPVYSRDNRNELKVLFLGTITLRKGIARLLHAMELLAEESPDIKCTIAGAYSLTIPERFQHLPNLKFIGKVDRNQVYEYYRSHDVFIFPTVSDGFGLTQLEAIAGGCYIVASEFCGDVIKGETDIGTLLIQNTPREMADVLKNLYHNRPVRLPETRLLAHLSAFSPDLIQEQYNRCDTGC